MTKMSINKAHIRIGEYIVQATNTGSSHEKFIVLDDDENQIGYEYDHATDAIEAALLYGNSP